MTAEPDRHTKRVALLRRGLMGAAGLAALALVGLSNLDRFGQSDDTRLRLGAGGPVIDNPDYQGRTQDGRAYRLSGATASTPKAGETRLTDPALSLDAGDTAPAMNVKAAEALLVTGEKARLQGQVEMRLSDGHVLKTQRLSVDLVNEILTVPERLTIDGPQLDMRAATLEGQLDRALYEMRDVEMTLRRGE